MNYIKYLEKIKNKNIQIGRIYRIKNYAIDGRRLIPIAKIIDIAINKNLTLKTYFADNNEEYIFKNFSKVNFTNIASTSEIDQFNFLENIKKYNL